MTDTTTTLYRYFSAAGRLLYVGISKDALRRLAEHEREQPWADDIAAVTLERFDDRPTAEAAELTAIRFERPLHNRAGTVPPEALELPATVVHDTKRLAYSPAEVAELLGICRATVYNLMQSGELASLKLGGKRLIRRSAVDQLLAGGAA